MTEQNLSPVVVGRMGGQISSPEVCPDIRANAGRVAALNVTPREVDSPGAPARSERGWQW